MHATYWTHCLFTPGAADGDDFFTEEELLLKTLQRKKETNSERVSAATSNSVACVSPCVSECLPFHTVYICPPAAAGGPSGVLVCSIGQSERLHVTRNPKPRVRAANRRKGWTFPLFSISLVEKKTKLVWWIFSGYTLTSLRQREPPSLKVGLHRKLIWRKTKAELLLRNMK